MQSLFGASEAGLWAAEQLRARITLNSFEEEDSCSANLGCRIPWTFATEEWVVSISLRSDCVPVPLAGFICHIGSMQCTVFNINKDFCQSLAV